MWSCLHGADSLVGETNPKQTLTHIYPLGISLGSPSCQLFYCYLRLWFTFLFNFKICWCYRTVKTWGLSLIILFHYCFYYLAQWLTQNKQTDKYPVRILLWENREKRSKNLMFLIICYVSKSTQIPPHFARQPESAFGPSRDAFRMPPLPSGLSHSPWCRRRGGLAQTSSPVSSVLMNQLLGGGGGRALTGGIHQFVRCKILPSHWLQTTKGLTISSQKQLLNISQSAHESWCLLAGAHTGLSAPAVSVVEDASPGE